MDFKNCLAILNSDKQFDGMTSSQKDTLLKEVADEVKRLRLENKEGEMDIALTKYINKKLDEDSITAVIEQRNALFNLEVTRKLKSFSGNFKNKFEAIQSYLVGTIKLRQQGNNSIDHLQKQGYMEKQGQILKLMEDNQVWSEFVSGKIDREIWQEAFELHPGGTPGKSGNPKAEKIVQILAQVLGDDIDTMNRWGAWITKRKGGLIRQTWDIYKMERAKYDTWYRDMLEHVDLEETLKDVAPGKEKQFWLGVYRNLTSGAHLQVGQPKDLITAGFSGPGNLAKRISTAHRIIIFKDADAAYRMNQKYGAADLRETVNKTLIHNHRNIGMLQTLGTNPERMFVKWIKDMVADASKRLDADPDNKVLRKEVRDLKQAEIGDGALWRQWKDLTGETQQPGNVTGANLVHSIMNITNMAKLGGAFITSWADSPNVAKEMSHHGISTLNSYGSMLRNLTIGMPPKTKTLVMRMIGVGLDTRMGNMVARFHHGDMIPGMWAKGQQLFFKYNLLMPWTDTHDAGIANALALHVAHNLDNFSYKTMDLDLKRTLSEHGILEHEFNAFKNAIFEHEGYRLLVTEKIRKLDDGVVLKYLQGVEGKPTKTFSKAKLARTRDELAGKYMTYISHAVDRGVPKPSAAERAIMQRGTKAGSAQGAALRLLFQFKGFPITVIRKSLGREVFGHGAETLTEALFKGKGNLRGLAHLIVAMTVMGYVSLITMDLLRGKEPRQFKENDMAHNVKILMASMAKGGGLGLYGDFLFGQFNRYGRSPTHTLLGPTLGQFDDVWHLYSLAFQQGDFKGALNQMLRIVHGNTPFINMFYLRMLLDYFIMYNLMELQNPGSLRRMESRMKKDNNQEFYISPKRVITRGGTINIGEIISNMHKEVTR